MGVDSSPALSICSIGVARHHEHGAVIDTHGAVHHQRGQSRRRCAQRSAHRRARAEESSSSHAEPSSTRAQSPCRRAREVHRRVWGNPLSTHAESSVALRSRMRACAVNPTILGSHTTLISRSLLICCPPTLLPSTLAILPTRRRAITPWVPLRHAGSTCVAPRA